MNAKVVPRSALTMSRASMEASCITVAKCTSSIIVQYYVVKLVAIYRDNNFG